MNIMHERMHDVGAYSVNYRQKYHGYKQQQQTISRYIQQVQGIEGACSEFLPPRPVTYMSVGINLRKVSD